jgi:hypothetical protein
MSNTGFRFCGGDAFSPDFQTSTSPLDRPAPGVTRTTFFVSGIPAVRLIRPARCLTNERPSMKLAYADSKHCPVCEGRGVIEYADVYSDVDGTAMVAWEISGVIACGCKYKKGTSK